MIENPQVRKVLNEVVSRPKGWSVQLLLYKASVASCDIAITGRVVSFASSVVSCDAPALVVDDFVQSSIEGILACTAQH